MIGYKGFDKDWKCKDKQYKVGETFEHKGDLKLCNSGLHFCENPLDLFTYYNPAESRYAEIEAEEVSKEKSDDSKRVAKKLTIKAELGLRAVIDLSVKFILEKVDFMHSKESNTGYRSAATNTGNQSAAIVEGAEAVAISLGIEGKAKGILGCWLVLAEWEEIKNEWHRINVKSVKVDRKRIKPNVFYVLKNNKVVLYE